MNEESTQTQKELDIVTDKLSESLTLLELAEDSINELIECINHQKTSLDKLSEDKQRLREALGEAICAMGRSYDAMVSPADGTSWCERCAEMCEELIAELERDSK